MGGPKIMLVQELIFYFRLMAHVGFCDIVAYYLKANFLNAVYSKQRVYGFQMLIVTCFILLMKGIVLSLLVLFVCGFFSLENCSYGIWIELVLGIYLVVEVYRPIAFITTIIGLSTTNMDNVL